MNKSFILLFVLWLSPIVACHAIMTVAKDTLSVVVIPMPQVIDTGYNCVWDYSQIPTDPTQQWYIHTFSDSVIAYINLHLPEKNYQFIRKDSLYLHTLQDPIHCLFINSPLLLRTVQDSSYFDSVSSTWHGLLAYSQTIRLPISGTHTILCDGRGELRLPGNIHIEVFKMHYILSYTSTSTPTPTQVVKEYNAWLSASYTYPLLISHSTSIILENDTSSFQSAYYLPQENTRNRLLAKSDTLLYSDSLTTEYWTILDVYTHAQYAPNPVISDLQISYTLTRSASISFSIHNQHGLLMYSSQTLQQSEGEHIQTISMQAFPIGTYVLYVYVDDQIITETVLKI